MKTKRTPAPKVERTPAKKKSIYDQKKAMLRWKLMREAEKKRIQRSANKKRQYTMYKMKWFMQLITEATRLKYFTDWDIRRLKMLRHSLEKVYKIPLNLYSAFIYYSTYQFLKWDNRAKDFSNYVGFLCNEKTVVNFANFVTFILTYNWSFFTLNRVFG